MGTPKRRLAHRAGRPPMRSPGRPTAGRREHRRRFWAAIACGLSSEDAALAAGVSQPVGTRWFRENGGMPSISLATLSGRYLSFAEREEVAILHARHFRIREARRISRSPSTISRELRRNAATRSGGLEYRATTAQSRRPEGEKDRRWRSWLHTTSCAGTCKDRLEGMKTAATRTRVPGPNVHWNGRRHGRCQDRRWAASWSPEQIANRLKVDPR